MLPRDGFESKVSNMESDANYVSTGDTIATESGFLRSRPDAVLLLAECFFFNFAEVTVQ